MRTYILLFLALASAMYGQTAPAARLDQVVRTDTATPLPSQKAANARAQISAQPFSTALSKITLAGDGKPLWDGAAWPGGSGGGGVSNWSELEGIPSNINAWASYNPATYVGPAILSSLNGKEPTLPTGTTLQYFRGDKSLATFSNDVGAFAIRHDVEQTLTDEQADQARGNAKIGSYGLLNFYALDPETVIGNGRDVTGSAQQVGFATIFQAGAPDDGKANGRVLKWDSTIGANGAAVWRDDAGTTFDYAPKTITGNVIDLSAGLRLQKVLSANWSPTFLNEAVNRGPVEVVIVNPSVYTVTWPSPILWDNATVPTQSQGNKQDVYEFRTTASQIWGKRIFTNLAADLFAPTIQSAETNNLGTQIKATFSETLDVGTSGFAGFSLVPSDVSLDTPTIVGGTITWNTGRPILTSEAVTLSFVKPSDGLKDPSGNYVANFGPFTVTNLSGISAFLGAFDFEEVGLPAGMVTFGTAPETNVSFDYTLAPLAGAESLRILSASGGSYVGVDIGTVPLSTFSMYAQISLTSRATTTNQTFLELLSSTGAAVAQVQDRFNDGNKLRISSGGQAVTTGSGYTTGNKLGIWLDYVAGSGTNGRFEIRVSNTGSKTRPASASAIITTSTSTSPVTKIRIGTRTGISMTVDYIRYNSVQIGDVP